MDLRIFFDELEKTYGGGTEISPPDGGGMEQVPPVLKPLYEYLSRARLPFGTVYPVEHAVECSARQPFFPEWFVFGKDNYFSFWLCAYSQDSEGRSFTLWDHGSGAEIDSAVYPDVGSFLQRVHEDYIELQASLEEDEDDDFDGDEDL